MLDWLFGKLPTGISTYASDVDNVIWTIGYVVFIWWLIAEVILFAFLIIYRKKKGKKSQYVPANTMKAMSWVLIPVFLVFVCDILIDIQSHAAWDKIKIKLPKSEVIYKVSGVQFAWNYTHPGIDGKFGTLDDFEPDELVVPISKVVHIRLTAEDVLHSLWIPHLRFKQDAVPGRTITGWFEATKTGNYPIACAELCGSEHGYMKSKLKVLELQAYNSWVRAQSEEALSE